jgi:hypothetical protein
MPQSFQLEAFKDIYEYVGSGNLTPELHSVSLSVASTVVSSANAALFKRCLKMLKKNIAFFKSFMYPLYDSMRLLYCGVPLPESELIIGY